MKYLISTFRIDGPDDLEQACKDLLANCMAEAGFESFEETRHGINGYVRKEVLDTDIMKRCIEEFPIHNVEISYEIEEVEDKDWNEEWERKGFDPIVVADQLIIYDAKRGELHPGISSDHIEIGIDAVQAFGTGSHQTTRLVIGTMLTMNLYKKRVLDCGCGTGILGIAAAKMGARDIVGYDIDEWSVENTRHNAELNQVDNITVYHGDVAVLNHVSGLFDLVMANINRNTLLSDMGMFRNVMAPGATLILSGFFEEDIPLVIEKAGSLDFRLAEERREEHWGCLVFHV